MQNETLVPKVHAYGKFDGDLVVVAYHDKGAVWFRRLSGGVFPIYLADWPEFSYRLDFPEINLAPYGTRIFD